MKTPNIVIADLDGTIALIERRRHWLDKDKHVGLSTDERWRKFYADCVNDQPNQPVIDTLWALRWDWRHIHIFSGRSDEVRYGKILDLNEYEASSRQNSDVSTALTQLQSDSDIMKWMHEKIARDRER